jgi:hypothetical protein
MLGTSIFNFHKVCHFITISDKLTNLVEVEDEIQLTVLACSQHSTKHFNKMQIKLSYARESTWSLEIVIGQSIRNYKDPQGLHNLDSRKV